MKKYIVFILLLIASAAFAWNTSMIGGSGGCTPTLLHEETDVAGIARSLYDTQSYGQSFTTDASIHTVYSVQVYLTSVTELEVGDDDTFTVRIGTTSNLTTYITNAQATLTITPSTSTGWIEFIFATPPSLSASTKYYFGVVWPRTSSDRIQIAATDGDDYVNHEYVFNTTVGGWNMSGSSTARDLSFKVYTCE